ncbi:MAG: 2Fe-2S iron-sulfur cluster-binding protein [Bryobacteraceae bacterium]|jgi:xanthine dehydrogenase YagT iron-sulfur-binding subunit
MPRITVKVNGQDRSANLPAGATLLEFLHDALQLSGVRAGCEEGVCGACTVLVDGRATRACMITAAACEGKAVTTLEGLSAGGPLHPVQLAFLRHASLRCGACTPGAILEAVALLESGTRPVTRRRIRQVMAGHACHCGMQERIIAAVEEAARIMGRLR